jgi:GNAT superfamily N-acetyltransferase
VDERVPINHTVKKKKLLSRGELNLFSFQLSRSIPEVEAGADAEYSFLDNNSGEKTASLVSLVGKDIVKARFNQGEVCGVAWSNSKVVSYCWLAFKQAEVGEINRIIKLSDKELYLYDAFTLPDYRGRGLFPALLTAILGFARSKSYSRALIFSNSRNRPSLRGIEKAGFSLFQSIHFLKLLDLRLCLPGRTRGKEPGVIIGKKREDV